MEADDRVSVETASAAWAEVGACCIPGFAETSFSGANAASTSSSEPCALDGVPESFRACVSIVESVTLARMASLAPAAGALSPCVGNVVFCVGIVFALSWVEACGVTEPADFSAIEPDVCVGVEEIPSDIFALSDIDVLTEIDAAVCVSTGVFLADNANLNSDEPSFDALSVASVFCPALSKAV